MLTKTYEEIRKIDVSEFCEVRDRIKYLNWAKCKELLHMNGAEKVYFEPITNANGSSLFMSDETFKDKNGMTNKCYEIAIKVVVDDNEWIFRGPVMNGTSSVKDNSMSQQRVWNAQTRAFVKCVAIQTGLGFDLWLKEEMTIPSTDDLNSHKILKIRERVEQLITSKLQKGLSVVEIAEKLNMTEEDFKHLFTYYKKLNKFEEAILKL